MVATLARQSKCQRQADGGTTSPLEQHAVATEPDMTLNELLPRCASSEFQEAVLRSGDF
jgi:hypothetical protein